MPFGRTSWGRNITRLEANARPSWSNEFRRAAISIKAFLCLIPLTKQGRKGHETSGADWKTKKPPILVDQRL